MKIIDVLRNIQSNSLHDHWYHTYFHNRAPVCSHYLHLYATVQGQTRTAPRDKALGKARKPRNINGRPDFIMTFTCSNPGEEHERMWSEDIRKGGVTRVKYSHSREEIKRDIRYKKRRRKNRNETNENPKPSGFDVLCFHRPSIWEVPESATPGLPPKKFPPRALAPSIIIACLLIYHITTPLLRTSLSF